jgi:uncharacterized membrane protein SpoIIM required for sporulation
MPLLVVAFLIVGTAALYFGYRALKRERQRKADLAREAQEKAVGPSHRGNLVWDERSGTYKPRD